MNTTEELEIFKGEIRPLFTVLETSSEDDRILKARLRFGELMTEYIKLGEDDFVRRQTKDYQEIIKNIGV